MLSLTRQQHEAIRDLCRAYNVTRLDLFGSAVRDDFDSSRSDVDMLVEFASGTDLGPWMVRFFEFRERLEVLLERSVDVVLASSVRNPYLARAIHQERQLLYAA